MMHRDVIGLAALAAFVILVIYITLEDEMWRELKTEEGHKILPPPKATRFNYALNTPVPHFQKEWKTIDGEKSKN